MLIIVVIINRANSKIGDATYVSRYVVDNRRQFFHATDV